MRYLNIFLLCVLWKFLLNVSFGPLVMVQEEGWPLGLQPLNVRNRGFNGSISFNTLITGSPSSSTDSSSDLDTQGLSETVSLSPNRNKSTASFFHDKSITLGSLIGITSILEFSRRSTIRRTIVEPIIRDEKINSNNKSRTWLFSLCSKLSTDAVSMNNINSAPSLGHFLEAERKAANERPNNGYGPDDFNQLSDHSNVNNNSNSLFIGGQIAPPPHDESRKGLFEKDDQNGHGGPLIFSCLCGHLVH
ncbi:hypothetical protein RND71_031277 [Anisodus tanguticus]|uniref:Uncharacterized protein n=1 Tax=Anisodus tanguticus TaxID=243964 RepID=A0AAE1RD25_9SOLA|nr:hypothetical protein RND71_031277 [Anisodus tanguticus]